MPDSLIGQLIQGTSGAYQDLTQADHLGIARYLKDDRPIRNTIRG